MRKAIIIEPTNNHFELLAREIEKYYNPFSFLFIGPTGQYVRQVSDKFAFKYGKTINKNAFMVINQYVTETLLKNNMDAVFFDRDFFKAFIAEKIEELVAKYDKHRDEYYDFLRVVSRSKGIIEYILDLFEKAWELNNSNNNSYTPMYYKEIEKILNQDGNLPRLVNELLEEIRFFFQKTENIFDPITTYKWYIENASYVETEKETLVISGFFDLTPLVKKALQKLFEKSNNVYFYVWRKIEDRAFKELDAIYEFLRENKFVLEEKKPVKLNLKPYTYGLSFKNPSNEIKYICGMVKKNILDGTQPGDIAIIAPTNQIMFQISEELKNMKIPHKLSGITKLSESKLIKMLLQPLKTIFSGYDMEDILALIETPYITNRKLTMDQIEELFKEFGFFFINLKSSQISKEHIQNMFLKPIQEKIDKLSQIVEDDTFQERMDKIDEYRNFKEIIESTFDLLINIENNMKNDFFEWIRNFIKDVIYNFSIFKEPSKYLNNESITKEINALFKFSEVIMKLQKYSKVIFKNKKTSWHLLYKILINILSVETYRTTNKYSNSVEILDITTARFVEKKYKFFVHFTDSYYPSFNTNPLILQASDDSHNFVSYIEENERRNIILSFIFSTKNFVSYPSSSLKGEPILPSQYMREFCNGPIKTENDSNILPSPENIFSIQDKKIYEALKRKQEAPTADKNQWVGKFKRTTLSHTKISMYVDCPFYFYLREIAKVKPISKNKESMYKGILFHRVLKEIFEKNITNLQVENIQKLVEKVYYDIFRNEIDQYSLPSMLKIKEFSELLTKFLSENLSEKGYLKIVKKFSLQRKKTKELESQYKETLKIGEKEYDFEIRIDRIDELDKNYTGFYGTNSKEVSENISETEKKAIAIIDYKSSLNKIYAEQLLLYDIVYRKAKKENFDSFLIFFNLSGKSPKNYFIKREGNFLILKGGGKKTHYYLVNYDSFINWLKNVLEKMSTGYFAPIALEENVKNKPFLSYVKETTQFDIKTTIETKCINFNYSCDFVEICRNLEIYKNAKLKK
ncbi:PD-(D/E)XK nuclease family protein [Thermosipho atlanticus]|uniref:UvrD-like helicase C-terminal domain-containing protein n=1 Tax=Thermosipho atlanticus DSM 15807 TaxID=1123380 RepID=A0A1M5T001_9BACT|nr:PD-(D/E)XK nuclease family protein [Thermosipho atlanticus]SHH44046.1 UvrD-like helicase C-terminal domain-containing protein [Thermosipho atlanticus DSM 15807]